MVSRPQQQQLQPAQTHININEEVFALKERTRDDIFSSLDPIHKEYRLQARIRKKIKNNNILPHFQRIIADDGHVLDISIVV